MEVIRRLGSFDPGTASVAFNGTVKPAVEAGRVAHQAPDLGVWHGLVSFPLACDLPAPPVSRASTTFRLAGTSGPDPFGVAGIDSRVRFILPSNVLWEASVAQGGRGHEGIRFPASGLWDGDEADCGINFDGYSTVLHVTLGG